MQNRKEKNIRRGDIYYANLNPVCGSEQGGIRPVLIIQNDQGNYHSPTVIVAATTGQLNKPDLPTHVLIKEENNTWLKKDTIILLEQIRTIDRTRLCDYIGHLSDDNVIKEIEKALAVSVGIKLISSINE
jgi:mRNA interferase MazF